MKNEQGSEVDKFFENLPSEDNAVADVFEDKKVPVPEKEEEEDEEETKSNRRERRMQAKLQQERESNILLAERLRAATEEKHAISENPDIDPRLIRIFGTGEKETELAKLFTGLLSETEERALNKIAQREEVNKEEVSKAETFIDTQLEAIEDAYGIDMTSNTAKATKTRNDFLELVEKLSPKDTEGSIIDYADFGSAFEVYQSTHQEKVDNSRQKQIASRSMQRSGSSTSSASRPRTPGFDGWKADFGLN